MTQPLDLAFMGTPEFAVPTLAALLEAGHRVKAVYSQPPRPVGRGHHTHPSPVHAFAESRGLEVRTPLSLKSPQEQAAFSALNLDVAVVVAYGMILPQAILDAPQYGCVNLHASVLPRWRGAAPIQRAILDGDAETGVTLMKVEFALDAGPILAIDRVPIDAVTTTKSLHDRLSQVAAGMIVPGLAGYVDGTLPPRIQPQSGITYARKLEKDEGRIRWTDSAAQIDRQVRALNPWPGVWFEFRGERIRVLEARPVSGSGPAGTVIRAPLVVACGCDAIEFIKVQRPGKAPLSAQDMLRGHAIGTGSVLE